MMIKEVTVAIHEKRSHPYEHGHYDAEISFTAEFYDGDAVESLVEDLKVRAARSVRLECDRWVAEIRLEHIRQRNR